MSITQTNTIAKIAAVVAGLGLVGMSFAFVAVPAKAATTADIQAQIQALLAQIQSLQAQLGTSGSTSGASTTFTANLTVGSRGADVTALQNFLIGKGYAIAAGATGYFGAQTKAALAAFQTANGISPAAGYFGPITRAKVNSMGSSTTTSTTGTTGTSTTPALQGGAGYLSQISTQGDIVSQVQAGDVGDKVVGISAQAVGSDIDIDRLDVEFNMTGTTGSTDLSRYVQSVNVVVNGTKVASMSPTQGSYNNKVWTLRFANIGGVIKEGTTGTVYVTVDALPAIGANEANQSLTVDIPANGIRALDATGVSDTYPSAETGPETQVYQNATTGVLTLTEAADDPAASTIKADPVNTTSNVTLLAFNAKATNQNVLIRALPVNLIAGAANISDYVQSVALMQGGTTLSTKTITDTGATSEVVFNNLNTTVNNNSTTEFTVVATIKKIDSGNTFKSGDTLYATTTNDAQWDASDANGNQVAPTGAVQGHHQTFQQTGITVTNAGTTATKSTATNSGGADTVQDTISFKVTAGDTDLYLSNVLTKSTTTALTDTAQNLGVVWATTTSSTATTTSYSSNLSAADSNSGDTTTYYKIPAGTSRTFTLSVTFSGNSGQGGYIGLQLAGINWASTSALANTSTNYFTSSLDQFKTADTFIQTH